MTISAAVFRYSGYLREDMMIMNVFLPMGERIPKHTTLQGLPEPI